MAFPRVFRLCHVGVLIVSNYEQKVSLKVFSAALVRVVWYGMECMVCVVTMVCMIWYGIYGMCVYSPKSIGYIMELMSRMRSILKDSLSQCRRETVKRKEKNRKIHSAHSFFEAKKAAQKIQKIPVRSLHTINVQKRWTGKKKKTQWSFAVGLAKT